jgi:hypothetical protein
MRLRCLPFALGVDMVASACGVAAGQLGQCLAALNWHCLQGDGSLCSRVP